mmetsp:Transcript_149487/g.372147  ORF Transcript_149487/g.372147 Transcript_149487/m.372147 type:complete len:213 (+) Transcript_149487:242-880(+)
MPHTGMCLPKSVWVLLHGLLYDLVICTQCWVYQAQNQAVHSDRREDCPSVVTHLPCLDDARVGGRDLLQLGLAQWMWDAHQVLGSTPILAYGLDGSLCCNLHRETRGFPGLADRLKNDLCISADLLGGKSQCHPVLPYSIKDQVAVFLEILGSMPQSFATLFDCCCSNAECVAQIFGSQLQGLTVLTASLPNDSLVFTHLLNGIRQREAVEA